MGESFLEEGQLQQKVTKRCDEIDIEELLDAVDHFLYDGKKSEDNLQRIIENLRILFDAKDVQMTHEQAARYKEFWKVGDEIKKNVENRMIRRAGDLFQNTW